MTPEEWTNATTGELSKAATAIRAASDHIKGMVSQAVQEAVLAEREACAAFVEDGANSHAGRDTCHDIAAAIRARCNP